MKKSDNLINLVFLALLCVNFFFLTACGDEDKPDATLPVIESVSANQTLKVGETLNLEIVASGDALTYQWYKDGAAITENTTANTSQYTKLNIAESDAGSYTCKVSNSAGSVTSIPMIVIINGDIIDNTPNQLSSASFEIVGDITDSITSYYADHGNYTNGIYNKFTIRNKSKYSLNYYVTVEKIAMPDSYLTGICIGECAIIHGTDLPETRNFPPNGGSIVLQPGATTNSEVDSYIKLAAGDDDAFLESERVPASPGQTMLRVTYVNAADPTDFIRFKLYWNFTADK